MNRRNFLIGAAALMVTPMVLRKPASIEWEYSGSYSWPRHEWGDSDEVWITAQNKVKYAVLARDTPARTGEMKLDNAHYLGGYRWDDLTRSGADEVKG